MAARRLGAASGPVPPRVPAHRPRPRNGAREPADAAKLLNATLDAFPDAVTAATPPPSDLAELAGQMRTLEHALARTVLPEDFVMMSATAHAHRCLDIGIGRVRADSAENLR